jgi:hypothetical protein
MEESDGRMKMMNNQEASREKWHEREGEEEDSPIGNEAMLEE